MVKKNNKNIITDQRALDMLTDKMESFELEDASGKKVTLHIYPFQLGRLGLISRRLLDLDLALDSDDIEDSVKRLWTVCAEKRQEVAEIIAIATLRTKEELDTLFEERVNLLLWSPTMTPDAFSNILYSIVAQSFYADFVKAIRWVRTLRVTISQMTEAGRIASTEARVSGDK